MSSTIKVDANRLVSEYIFSVYVHFILFIFQIPDICFLAFVSLIGGLFLALLVELPSSSIKRLLLQEFITTGKTKTKDK